MLKWPPGWERTPKIRKQWGDRFKLEDADTILLYELKKLGASEIAISTDRTGIDEGVAVYFTLRGEPRVMACDRYNTQLANMRSLGLAVQAMRQLERHGGGAMADRAFVGFAALPPPRSCWDILGIEPASDRTVIERAFRAKALKHHPDQGGSHKAMAELVAARDEAMQCSQINSRN